MAIYSYHDFLFVCCIFYLGPGSLSGCGMGYALGEDNMDNYNIISIDQRGMGRSEPSFVHEECEYADGLIEFEWTESGIQDVLDLQKEVVRNCWSCEDCGFIFEMEQEDGQTRTFHFLECMSS